MDNRNLTFDEFKKLSEEERCLRYKELSDQDKFKARCSQNTGVRGVPCNTCAHKWIGDIKCDAFPERIPRDHICKLSKTPDVECADGIRFEEKIKK